MKKLFASAVAVLLFLPLSAQTADEKIGDLLNTNDWFRLAATYQQVKDDIQLPFLKKLSEAMLDYHFGREQQAEPILLDLISNHQEELGMPTVLELNMIRLLIMGESGRYNDAADGAEKVLSQLRNAGNAANAADAFAYYINRYQDIFNTFNVLRNTPATFIVRPQKDVVVPFKKVVMKAKKREDWMKHGKMKREDFLLSIPVKIHGKNYPFIFDTGASRTLISERRAKEMGLKIFTDSVKANDSKARMTIIDSLQVGDMVCRNLLAYVGIDEPTTEITDMLDLILGENFIRKAEEVQIDYEHQKLIFPFLLTSKPTTGSNVFFSQIPYMKANKDGKPLTFVFDTGFAGADLSGNFYSKFKDAVDRVAVPDTVTNLTYGKIQTQANLYLPSVSFSIDGKPVTINEIHVNHDGGIVASSEPSDGMMGTALIRLFKKITLNLRDMFIKFE